MRGGLGNQMFQYAFGKACSLKLGEPLSLDLSWYKGGKRKFLLDQMNVSYNRSVKNPIFAKILEFLNKKNVVKGSRYFDEKYLKIEKNQILDGYWESPKYFSSIENLIKNEFTLKKPSDIFLKLSKKIEKNSISVHIRRGDYLVPHGKSLNGIEYCNEAVKYIVKNKNLTNPKILIFSDDPSWCKENVGILGGFATEVFEEKLNSDVETLMFMSLYENNVISNSTFSWWAGFLNKNPNKMVVMPKNWLTDHSLNERYLESIKSPGWILC